MVKQTTLKSLIKPLEIYFATTANQFTFIVLYELNIVQN